MKKTSRSHSRICNSVLDRIVSEDIKPRSSWYFRLKNLFFLSIFALSLFCGAVAMSVLIFRVNEIGIWDIPGSPFALLIRTISYVWIVLFIGLIMLSYFGLQQTKKGYRMPLRMVLIFNLGATLLIGSSIYYFGGGDVMEFLLERTMKRYETLDIHKQRLWDAPEEGRIAGEIIAINDEKWWLKDFNDQHWSVDMSELEESFVHRADIGLHVRIVGELSGMYQFKARRVALWEVNPWERVKIKNLWENTQTLLEMKQQRMAPKEMLELPK